jgi:hypothetical protein
MKPISDKLIDALEEVAVEGVKQIKALFAYQGEDRRYFEKAKVAASTISGYARIRASETNRAAVEAQAARDAKKS